MHLDELPDKEDPGQMGADLSDFLIGEPPPETVEDVRSG